MSRYHKHIHQLHQMACLIAKAIRSAGGLLHQGGVLLGNLIELVDRQINLADAGFLLGRRDADFFIRSATWRACVTISSIVVPAWPTSCEPLSTFPCSR